MIQFCVAGVAQSGNPVIVCFQASSLAVPPLVGMSGNNRPVRPTAVLTGRFPDGLKQFLVAVHQRALAWMICCTGCHLEATTSVAPAGTVLWYLRFCFAFDLSGLLRFCNSIVALISALCRRNRRNQAIPPSFMYSVYSGSVSLALMLFRTFSLRISSSRSVLA